MQLTFGPDLEAKRTEFVDWLEANLPVLPEDHERPRSTAHLPSWARDWQRTLFDAGWLLPGNPPTFGGRDASLLEQFVYAEELSNRRILRSFNPQGLGIVAPSILSFGTDEQKHRWAVPILRAEITAALGMSEPNAGSDLASLSTRAVRDGDDFVLNGQKVWTSGAHDADMILVFVRTDPDAAKHKGISALIVSTDTPGVTRRPFADIIGPEHTDFNEVFFDDARVPAENLLGDLNDGWRICTGSLGHERAMLWLDMAEALDDARDHSVAFLRDRPEADEPLLRDQLAGLAIDAVALRVLGHRTLAKMNQGLEPSEQSILKLFGSEALREGLGNVLEALGSAALDVSIETSEPQPFQDDRYRSSWFERYLYSFSYTIAGGTSEIQRNIVAERVLGLPRG